MTYEDIKSLAEEYLESIQSQEDKDALLKFAKDCIGVTEMPKSLIDAQKVLHKYDRNNLKEKFNAFIKQINPHLNPYAVWETA